VICWAKLEYGACHSKEFLLEFTDENGVTVIDYLLGHAMKLDYTFHKFFGYHPSSEGIS
jgi:hypothetical protein